MPDSSTSDINVPEYGIVDGWEKFSSFIGINHQGPTGHATAKTLEVLNSMSKDFTILQLKVLARIDARAEMEAVGILDANIGNIDPEKVISHTCY